MFYKRSYYENYRRAISTLINSYDNNFPNTEEDWDEMAHDNITALRKKYRKPYWLVLGDVVEIKDAESRLNLANDLQRYSMFNEYGELID